MEKKKENIQNARQTGSLDISSKSRSLTLALFLLLTGTAMGRCFPGVDYKDSEYKSWIKVHTTAVLSTLNVPMANTRGGRGQRRQRQTEESLRPYIGRVQPEKLCELLKCHTPVGSWCQVVKDKGVLVPKCICPKSCSRQRAPVCSVVGKTYRNECSLHKEACRKKRRTGLAHAGACMVPRANCTQEELGQFPYRLLDWFLLLSRMGESYAPDAPTQSCLSHAQRVQLAQQRFALLDRNGDRKLSRRDLKKLHYKRMPLEHCATSFFQSCDRDRNRKVTLREWTTCLVDNSEAWFYHFMSIKMGSHKLCPTRIDDDL